MSPGEVRWTKNEMLEDKTKICVNTTNYQHFVLSLNTLVTELSKNEGQIRDADERENHKINKISRTGSGF